MKNRLQNETSPYLLQHADNPVDWYPWGKEALERAKNEDKPIFLSIGYSTCHWCHVMAHESFEDEEIADILNRHYVCIKVDREERPDIDNVYMTACQAMTGGGGWPTSLFLTPEGKPFFAGTYFPPKRRHGTAGFYDLIVRVAHEWQVNREALVESADRITQYLKNPQISKAKHGQDLPKKAADEFKRRYDSINGGFGVAPKFPTPHNLLFLMLYSTQNKDKEAIDMALHTLMQMRKGGIYDHIGGGFSRYSTDNLYLVPHFEKMLYDNALLMMAYCVAYSINKNDVFLSTAKDTAEYVLSEMRSSEGGFYSAQDADSEGGEGLYYVFDYDEILSVLGKEQGALFNSYFGVTKNGNFEGKNILNRLHGKIDDSFAKEKQALYEYRSKRMKLHLDDKILTSWNSLMIIARTYLYRVSGEEKYLNAAKGAREFIEKYLCENDRLYVSFRNKKRSGKGFLEDYAFYCAALIALYSAEGKNEYLERAKRLTLIAVEQFGDLSGGFFTSGTENERLVFETKEAYDGAIPSGNTMLYFVLERLSELDVGIWDEIKSVQKEFLYTRAAEYPAGHTVFMLSLLFEKNPPPKITAVCGEGDKLEILPLYADICVLKKETEEYKLLNGRTTFYICRNRSCLPPTNDIGEVQK